MRRLRLKTVVKPVIWTRIVLLISLALLAGVACGPATPDEDPTATSPPPAATQEDGEGAVAPTPGDSGEGSAIDNSAEAYPGPADASAYPGAEESATDNEDGYPSPPVRRASEPVSEPPNPERDLPQSTGDLATVGGVLIEEILDHGFVPLMPRELTLGSIVTTTEGEPAFLSTGSAAPKAELFQTGVFVFRDIEPGSYGLIVDVGHIKFPVETPEGDLLIFELEAGEVLDLGQVITPLPN